jgi:septal ring factor EnvC (AmiA/AmiB activator)
MAYEYVTRAAAPILLLMTLSGCASQLETLRQPGAWFAGDELAAAEHLALAATLTSGTDDQRAAAAAAVQSAFSSSPSAANRLRLAIVHATPHHGEFAPERAREDLRLLLVADDALSPVERDLARTYLSHVERELASRDHAASLRRQITALEGNVGRLESRLLEVTGEVAELTAQIRRLTALERSAVERAQRVPPSSDAARPLGDHLIQSHEPGTAPRDNDDDASNTHRREQP